MRLVLISGSESGIPFSCCSLLSLACMATEPETICFVGLVPCDASWVFDAGNLIEPRYGHWEEDSPRFRFGLRPTEEEVSMSVELNMEISFTLYRFQRKSVVGCICFNLLLVLFASS